MFSIQAMAWRFNQSWILMLWTFWMICNTFVYGAFWMLDFEGSVYFVVLASNTCTLRGIVHPHPPLKLPCTHYCTDPYTYYFLLFIQIFSKIYLWGGIKADAVFHSSMRPFFGWKRRWKCSFYCEITVPDFESKRFLGTRYLNLNCITFSLTSL